MSNDDSSFGELVLLIGDMYIPERARELPLCFRELLNTDKISTVLCTGNIGSSKEMQENVRVMGQQSIYVVRPDIDGDKALPEYITCKVGDFRVGLIHGHQITPQGDLEALSMWQRKLDVDILVYGSPHLHGITEHRGKFFINPGSATGAYDPNLLGSQAAGVRPDGTTIPAFMLMAVQGSNAVVYVYQEIDGKADVGMSEFKKCVDKDVSADHQ
ncbi:vacuolar protein sorting, putative [Perkinsus marinus ATCC 50983]|uniref:Vacuolar protein sorting-associated protein 29 n=1 Tax=Perkinsus marinus (strain ATCC 50983 / TXsc) TaxID=423536 RepID=C5KLC1_PERM5|nr:vacuolar protein sorting, putative [Perkinsus marinus ATCC 50983]XP_002782998.1 vacuolar protein sorting, putative [Perkinsus marinus ATCC 50983]EEQ97502.1 vacuolar protein sorting, putative [Perkinsus marinus ATCC 50983]EER14794.1 vacuolar protein sorting, putative [Perkinsus marinus ATCC 50983]|eukprot:XP_002764785.1 vacuolar protein sorting, putative [Perkinsus marinus ATCC 50983]